jgi:hypothetical protein
MEILSVREMKNAVEIFYKKEDVTEALVIPKHFPPQSDECKMILALAKFILESRKGE